MSEESKIGEIVWRDLTVDKAEQVSDFYASVVGWQKSPVSMGEYDDFNMNTSNGETIAGVCHARGGNADIPPQWMMYVRVKNVNESLEQVRALGGRVLKGPTDFSGDRYYIIEDPAGAILTIFSTLN